jgi:homoserine kinase
MIRISVPATSANLGPGFDSLGLALEEPLDRMSFREIDEGVVLRCRGYPLPADPGENIAGIVAHQILKSSGMEAGVEIRLEKGIRPGSGLGSSAASAAGTAYGISLLFNLPVDPLSLLDSALFGEAKASGYPHGDNLAPCLFGGLTLVLYRPLRVLALPLPDDLRYAVLLPEKEVSTLRSRAILPPHVPLEGAIDNIGNAAAFTAALFRDDLDLLGEAMKDRIAEPLRRREIPLFDRVRETALRGGAKGVAISGSGPAILALCDGRKTDPWALVEAMAAVYEEEGLSAETYAGRPGKGCREEREGR